MKGTISLDTVLAFDPLAEVEKITGIQVGDGDGLTDLLAMAVSMEFNTQKTNMLKKGGDTIMGDTVVRYISILDRLGFSCVYTQPFKSNWDVLEMLFVYAKLDEGLILVFNTYNQNKVNGANLYYNWQPNTEPKDMPYGVTESGTYLNIEGYVWAGYHDAREALAYKLNRMRKYGTFITPWKGIFHFWPFGHGKDLPDVGVPNYKALVQERISKLPKTVQDVIGGNYA